MYHVPILKEQIIQALRINKDSLILDGTLGGGGHSEGILEAGARLIGIDRDSDAIEECSKRFAAHPEFDGRYTLVKDNYKNAKEILGDTRIDGALLDMGISSYQVDTPQRGFAYSCDAPLDMRMDNSQSLTAETVINEYSEQELAKIMFEYGEERFSKRIARNIVAQREKRAIKTTSELSAIIRQSVPQGDMGPLKRVFQAVRIEVNGELSGLDKALYDIFESLNPGARFCVIAFHSLEDRIVKNVFKELTTDCICDKSLPICVCNHKAAAIQIARIRPSAEETRSNPRSASATLRIIEKK